MKFKSWYLILGGILFQSVLGFLIIASAEDTNVLGGLVALIIGLIVVLTTLAAGLIPMLLLAFKKTRKLGAIVSIIVGIIAITTSIGILLGILMLLAGILALWRKI